MKTKKSNSKYLAELTGDFKKVADRYEGQKDKGYVFVAYDKDDEDTIANAYHGAGSPVDLAECLYACMKRPDSGERGDYGSIGIYVDKSGRRSTQNGRNSKTKELMKSINIKRLSEDALLPKRATEGAACFDLYVPKDTCDKERKEHHPS